MPLVLDIETVPLERSLELAYPEAQRNPPANYKSEDTIEKWRKADRERWEQDRIKDYSLNWRLGRIVALGMMHTEVQDSGEVHLMSEQCIVAPEEADETHLLQAFWAAVAAHQGEVVTWNGSWDLAFLIGRSAGWGVTPTLSASLTRQWQLYRSHPHFDCKRELLNGQKLSGEGLDQWAAFFGVPGKLGGLTGADVWPLLKGGMVEEIAEYCQGDVRATAAIYARIKRYYQTEVPYVGRD
jgi:hypothetical protein